MREEVFWGRRLVVGWLFLLTLACGPTTPDSPASGDPGETVAGGAGGDTCRVSSLASQGPGTLFECVRSQVGARVIAFDLGGEIQLPENLYLKSRTTIDGTTAPSPGVTLRMTGDRRRGIVLEGPISDVVVRGLRFQGAWGTGEAPDDPVEYDLLSLDGEDGLVSRVLVERCTFIAATDGALDITGRVSDATVLSNLFYGNPLTMLIKYDVRERLFLHRNVFAENGERNPQVHGDVRTIDFRNNVVFDWTLTADGYGTLVRNDGGASVSGNFVNNAFVAADAQDVQPGFALESLDGAGPGQVWVAGNICRPACAVVSTAGAPLPVPSSVASWPASELGERILPSVGSPYRSATDQAVVSRVAAALAPRPR